MSKNFSRTIKILSLLVAILLVICFLQEFVFFHFDSNKVRIDGFYYEEKDSLDVVFLGASDVYSGYSAGLAYEKYRFTSYPYVIDSNSPSLLKSQLKEVLKKQTPQLIVIEVNGFLYSEDSLLFEEPKLRRYVDNMPMSLNKLVTIATLEYDDRFSCLFPIAKYHSNWQDAAGIKKGLENRISLANKPSLLKGMSSYTINDENKGGIIDVSNDNATEDITLRTKEYLIDFLEYCKENNIDNLLFVRFPHRIKDGDTYERFARGNTVGEIVNEYGFDYISFDKNIDKIGLNPNQDYYNDDHLNIYGQIKFTEFLGDFLVKEYRITPREQSAKNKEQWEKSVLYTRLYFEYLENCIQNKVELWPYENIDLINELESLNT